MTSPASLFESVADEGAEVLVGTRDVLEHLTISLLTGGHVLLEGVPGVAKTTIANAFARTTGLGYSRIQMTPDVMPADVTGTHVYREQDGEFDLQRGPVFANVVVADEINRATPKTQSALLEAMQERHVTIEGETLDLPRPFLLVATQNPIEMEGTFELPETQRDRFQFKLTVDLPDRDDERAIVDQFDANPGLDASDVESVVSAEDVLDARSAVADVHVSEAVKEYLLDVVAATRDSSFLTHGASPRATLTFMDAAKARAAIHEREYVIPDDVKALTEPVLAHRVAVNTDAELSDVSAADAVADAVDSVEPPGANAQFEPAVPVGDGGRTTTDKDS